MTRYRIKQRTIGHFSTDDEVVVVLKRTTFTLQKLIFRITPLIECWVDVNISLYPKTNKGVNYECRETFDKECQRYLITKTFGDRYETTLVEKPFTIKTTSDGVIYKDYGYGFEPFNTSKL